MTSILATNTPDWMLSDPSNDTVFEAIIAPFIAQQQAQLKALDEARPTSITYIFHEHVVRVATMGRDVALALGAQKAAANWFYHALLLHDCGKVLLPVTLWDTDGKPTEQMKIQRRQHAPIGAAMIEANLPHDHPFTFFASDIARHHHEQMDGGGIMGVHAATLSAWVRLACIVDSFDGMSIQRRHANNRDTSRASVFTRIAVEKGPHHYDPDMVAAFGKFLGSGPINFIDCARSGYGQGDHEDQEIPFG